MTRAERVENLRKKYPAGTRVVLKEMDDKQAPPVGTKGTVNGVDDMGSILVSWDTGSSLNLIDGIDEFTVTSREKETVEAEIVTCVQTLLRRYGVCGKGRDKRIIAACQRDIDKHPELIRELHDLNVVKYYVMQTIFGMV